MCQKYVHYVLMLILMWLRILIRVVSILFHDLEFSHGFVSSSQTEGHYTPLYWRSQIRLFCGIIQQLFDFQYFTPISISTDLKTTFLIVRRLTQLYFDKKKLKKVLLELCFQPIRGPIWNKWRSQIVPKFPNYSPHLQCVDRKPVCSPVWPWLR